MIQEYSSLRVIEKNGGVLENQLILNRSDKSISRYWITLLRDSRNPDSKSCKLVARKTAYSGYDNSHIADGEPPIVVR